ncbi:hypothetical protein B0T17DRAFT_108615 [Bombardia bombarda]|uniref:Uncharacterized protein n=1 Tax=Bombardia bombarda TaxID=252184 RepID=A0AA40CHF9_9PEZI|nr:hypothetical protein B0T17DRAFT_108615 [Bombardia bombarda]
MPSQAYGIHPREDCKLKYLQLHNLHGSIADCPSSSLPSCQSPPSLVPCFPQSFNGYYSEAEQYTMIYSLGEDEDKPVHALSMTRVRSRSPYMILHSGKTTDSPPLASLYTQSGIKISLPGLHDGDCKTEEAARRSSTSAAGFTFETEVAHGQMSGLKRERFEWRPSRSKQVRALGQKRQGWKLVRMSGLCGDGPTASDGNEVVAVCALQSRKKDKRVSFRFLGSGQENHLGGRWAMMAVMTGLYLVMPFYPPLLEISSYTFGSTSSSSAESRPFPWAQHNIHHISHFPPPAMPQNVITPWVPHHHPVMPPFPNNPSNPWFPPPPPPPPPPPLHRFM